MSFKSIVRELKEMRDGIGSRSRRGGRSSGAGSSGGGGGREGLAPVPQPLQHRWQGRWADLPSELLHDVIERVEASEGMWPARRDVVACASVCKSWREVTKEIVRTPEECAKITFPISLKQPGPRENPIQCFIRREGATGTYRLYLGLSPALQGENGKLLLAACKIKRAASTDYMISLVSDDFSRASSAYVGKLRSNFLGTKFTVYDSQPSSEAAIFSNSRLSRRLHSRQVSPRVPTGNYHVATICYELNVLRTRGPRKMLCTLHSIPNSAVQESGVAPTPTGLFHSLDEQFSALSVPKHNDPIIQFSSTNLTDAPGPVQTLGEPLILKNKAPRWHDQLQCWCLNFRGRVTVASVKNFQLVAAGDPSQQGSSPEQDRVILQFGKIGKDIFTMDYRYPLSAFQAFAICLSGFDTKPVCE